MIETAPPGQRALTGLADLGVGVTGLVSYSSAGRLLIVAPQARTLARLAGAAAPLRPAALLLSAGERDRSPGLTTWRADREEYRSAAGWATFGCSLARRARARSASTWSWIWPNLPASRPTYRRPVTWRRGPRPALDAALDTLRELVGDFDKPRYFDYDPDICAHGMKGTTACRRCIDACPADAITSLANRVQVEPYLCQGGGACATACPTGAMTYAYPSVEDVLRRSGGCSRPTATPAARRRYCSSTTRGPAPSGRGPWWTAAGHILPLTVEEVASLGLEAWLSALAYGAGAVRLLDTPVVPASSRRELSNSSASPGRSSPVSGIRTGGRLARRGGRGFGPDAGDRARRARRRRPQAPALLHRPGSPEGPGGPHPHPLVELPAGAPFGTATVDEKACTLCMACVTVCPGKALLDGQDVPQLRFLEANCVQCGLCTRSCPEDAIWITPRLLFDAQARGHTRLLREDSPFQCVSCGKAFATTAVIGRMQQRLAGHSMFRTPRPCGDSRCAATVAWRT